ncbi:MAG: hypothetical protein IIA85_00160 [Nanoarchaeota archaeon]|nr:hypothetical protein [Nanoarchaeota archaeon]
MFPEINIKIKVINIGFGLREGKSYQFRGFVKSELLVRCPEIASAMKRARFKEVLTEVESGSGGILSRHLHKGTSPRINYKAAEICLEYGIDFKALTMLGHTSESLEDIRSTRDWLLKTGRMFL